MFRQYLKVALFIVLTFAVSFAQSATAPSVSVDRLRQHVSYLASDALEGRRTGTPGAVEAANYIAKEFKRLGLKGVPTEVSLSRKRGAVAYYDSYFQSFPYVAAVDLGPKNSLTSDAFTPVALRLGEDWMPLGISSNGSVEGAIMFAGFGITAPELNYNDYANADVTGKIAVVLSGTPDGDNPHSQFLRYEDVPWKAIAARNAGAKALLVIAREDVFQHDRLARLRYDNSAGDARLPVAVISRQAALRLFPSMTLTEIEAAARNKTASVNRSSVQISLATDLIRKEVPALNVIGVRPGSDPVMKNEAIVIGAHYDHLGRGGPGSLALKEGEIHHGADDNASGTAGVLELARIFTSQNIKPKRSIIFIAFGGEEEGLLGSNYYVNHPPFPLANTVAMINMDMIGRMNNKRLIVGGVGTAKEWRSLIDNANLLQTVTVTAHGTNERSVRNVPIVVAANGQTIVSSDSSKKFTLTINEDGFGPSDHSSFYLKKIPVLFMWTGTHADYHKPSDTADKINYEDEARILSFVKQIIDEVDRGDKRPEYTAVKSESTGRTMGFRVYLGTIPNYADSSDSLLLDGVREDSPAAKAGLKPGDRIVKLAGRDVRNVYDYTAALGEMKAGEEYEVEIVRGAERLTLKIVPAARR